MERRHDTSKTVTHAEKQQVTSSEVLEASSLHLHGVELDLSLTADGKTQQNDLSSNMEWLKFHIGAFNRLNLIIFLSIIMKLTASQYGQCPPA